MRPTFYQLLCIACLLALPAAAHAAGMGVYGSYAGGKSWQHVDARDWGGDFEKNWTVDHSRGNFGLVVDTCVAGDKSFNYRMNVGHGYGTVDVTRKRRDLVTDLVTTKRYHYFVYDWHFYNTFGIGVVRTKLIRFFLGPQIGICYMNDVNAARYSEFSFKLGLDFGLNINVGSFFTISPDGGVRFVGNIGTNPMTSYGYEGFATLAFIFRMGDTYSAKDAED